MVRIYNGLIDEDGALPVNGFAFYLEEAALVTLGLCYEKRGNFAGGAYGPILRKLEALFAIRPRVPGSPPLWPPHRRRMLEVGLYSP